MKFKYNLKPLNYLFHFYSKIANIYIVVSVNFQEITKWIEFLAEQ